MTLFFIAVMGGVAYYVFNQAVQGGKLVTVPEVTGMSITQAANVITQAGLELGAQRQVINDQVPEYHVILQRPTPNTVVRAGRKVNLTVSQGLETIATPNWIGKRIEDALVEIENARFLSGSIARMPHNLPRDTILAQEPAALLRVSHGSEVHLLVSDGPATQVQIMPDLIGKSLEEAQLTLGMLSVQAVPYKINRAGTEYETVLAQHPQPGTLLKENQEVTFDIRLRPTSFLPNARRKVSIAYTVPDAPTRVEIRVEMIGESGRRTVMYPNVRDYIDGRPPKLAPGTVMTFPPIAFANEITVQFYIGRQLHQTYYYNGDNPPMITDNVRPTVARPGENSLL
ncbi:MAG: PASTA domain-containing protein [Candidatus Hydrogenedentota bacterium]